MATFRSFRYCPICGDVSDIIEACLSCDIPMVDTGITKGDFKKQNPKMDYMEMIQAIYDQYVLTSPTFDPEAQKRREEWDRQIEEEARRNSDHVHAMLAQRAKENLPKCPTCGSTNIKKITTGQKAASVALWRFFSQKVRRQWHCNNCGHEW